MSNQTYPAAEATPAQDRATPACAHFGTCGGCQLQDQSYATQLRLKQARLRAQLEAANLELPELQLHPSAPLAYRNRIRLSLAEVDGQLRAGYLGAVPSPDDTPAFLPISECPIAAPILWRATEAFLAQINAQPLLWLRNPNQLPDQLELFTAADESSLQFTLYIRTAAKVLPRKLAADFTALCETLRSTLPELSGAGISILPTLSKERSRRNELPRPGPAWGKPGLTYRVAEFDYWVPRGAFFQANRFLIPELLSLVANDRTGQVENLHSDRGGAVNCHSERSEESPHFVRGAKHYTLAKNSLAFDLYAGVGLFSRALTTGFAQVTAVEIAEPAAAALAATKLKNLHAVKATTLDFLRVAVLDRDRPDLVVLDPPRTGAGAEVCALLARINAPRLVYVSCSPERLPADLAALTASGYRLAELHLFDLFPQTTHIETVAILTR
ncbi:MAG: 23S rRNA (uracil(1939)-C(5))-methyltransferase RlmD [Acidobacteriaceae bacterium]|nr:23S rRNA (uracil(1939)-C(5))-methyltransferase RlmD [Acidobacteriaceae bacterium]